MSNFFLVPTVFHQCFSWTALSDVNLCPSLISVTKANGDEGGTTSATWLCHRHNQSTHMTVWQWRHFLLASNTDCVSQIMLKQNGTKEITQNKTWMQMFWRMFMQCALRAKYNRIMVVSMSQYSCVLERIWLPYAHLQDIKELVKELEKW